MGSRPADYPSIEADLAMLRAYRSGQRLPRILGNVYLNPFRGWPELTGPALKGAQVKISNRDVTLSATTDARGAFSLATAPSGGYRVWAELPPYRMAHGESLIVPAAGCGYTDVELTTTSVLPGIVLDDRGRPVPKIPVAAWFKSKKLEDASKPYKLTASTDRNGQFAIAGLPDAEFVLSAGLTLPTTAIPFGRVFYPNAHSSDVAKVFHLTPGEHHLPVVLSLDPPRTQAAVRVQVLKDGKPLSQARVWAVDTSGLIAESAGTDARGVAAVPCLHGLKYELEAHTIHTRMPWRGIVWRSSRVPFSCDGRNETTVLIVNRSVPR